MWRFCMVTGSARGSYTKQTKIPGSADVTVGGAWRQFATVFLVTVRSALFCRMAEVTSLSADDVIGRSLYQFCYVNDLATLRHAHIEGGVPSTLNPFHCLSFQFKRLPDIFFFVLPRFLTLPFSNPAL